MTQQSSHDPGKLLIALLSPPQELPDNTLQQAQHPKLVPHTRSRELPAFQALLGRYVGIGLDFTVEGTAACRKAVQTSHTSRRWQAALLLLLRNLTLSLPKPVEGGWYSSASQCCSGQNPVGRDHPAGILP